MRKLIVISFCLFGLTVLAYPFGWSVYGAGNNVYKQKVGGQPVLVYSGGVGHACWSMDGSAIFFNKGNQIWSVNTDGTGAQQLGTLTTGSGATFCAYRPEPRTVLVWNGSNLQKINADTKVKTLVMSGNKSDPYGEFAISSDGSRVAARIGTSGQDLQKATVSSGSWSGYGSFCSASISPSGQLLTENVSGHKNLIIHNWNGGSSTTSITLNRTWDNQRFAVNSNDYISVLFDNGPNNGNNVGVHQLSTNKTVLVGQTPSNTQYPDFFVGDPGNNQPSCTDGLKNQDETDIDCGGSCPACPSCTDGIKNQDETGIDCGGSCDACPSTCTDGIKNQDETGIDCGGSCDACAPANCNDGVINGNETGVDCGGACGSCMIIGDDKFYIEIEASPPGDQWVFSREKSGYNGPGYYKTTIGSDVMAHPPSSRKIMTYKFNLKKGGSYEYALRGRRDKEGVCVNGAGDACNDIHMRVNNGCWAKTMVKNDHFKNEPEAGGTWNKWNWDFTSYECTFPSLKVGENVIDITYRSKGIGLDALMGRLKGTQWPSSPDRNPTIIHSSSQMSLARPNYSVISSPLRNQVIIRPYGEAAGEFTIYSVEGKEIKSFTTKGNPIFWSKVGAHGSIVQPGVYTGVFTSGKQTVSRAFVIF